MYKILSAAALSAALAVGLVSCGGSDEQPPPQTCSTVSGNVTAEGLEIRRPNREPLACREVPVPGATMGEVTCEQKAVDFSCVGQTSARETPTRVTLRACVETFGIGASSYGLTVAVMPEKKADGTPADPGYDVTGVAGQQADRTPPYGTVDQKHFLSTEVDIAKCADQGYVEVPNVETETDLVVRVTQQHLQAANRTYVDTYQYGTVLRNSAIVDAAGAPVTTPATCTPETCFVDETVNTIQAATYQTISRAAGVTSVQGERDLYDGVGQGHIAGEVQDCSSSDRVQNAVVALSATARKLSYFNVGFAANEGILDDPKPSSTRTLTNADGLYLGLAVDTMTGGVPVQVGAAVTQSLCGPDGICMCEGDAQNPAWTAADAGEAEATVLGVRTVYIFPDSVTIFTFDRSTYTAP